MIRFSVAEIFGNGMVLQRNKPIHIFGQAEEGDRVRVSIYDYHGRLIDEINSVSDRLEKWQVTLASMEVSKDNKIVVENTSSQEKIVISNVSVGEVWLAGGQSNMEFFNKYDKDWERTKNLPKNDSIHFYNVPQRAFEGHVTHNLTTRIRAMKIFLLQPIVLPEEYKKSSKFLLELLDATGAAQQRLPGCQKMCFRPRNLNTI